MNTNTKKKSSRYILREKPSLKRDTAAEGATSLAGFYRVFTGFLPGFGGCGCVFFLSLKIILSLSLLRRHLIGFSPRSEVSVTRRYAATG